MKCPALLKARSHSELIAGQLKRLIATFPRIGNREGWCSSSSSHHFRGFSISLGWLALKSAKGLNFNHSLNSEGRIPAFSGLISWGVTVRVWRKASSPELELSDNRRFLRGGSAWRRLYEGSIRLCWLSADFEMLYQYFLKMFLALVTHLG